MSDFEVSELRREYTRDSLNEDSIDPDPIKQFGRWLQQARDSQTPEPNAMTLATVDAQGRPTARVVLLKAFDAGGFVFYTNYNSAKGQHLARNGHAALVFWWHALERQVRIEGTVAKTGQAESEAYFRTRPRASRLGALASYQSQVIDDRAILQERFNELDRRYEDEEIPLPMHWGGYRLAPLMLEFWQGRASRLHDRLQFRLQDNNKWNMQRLEP